MQKRLILVMFAEFSLIFTAFQRRNAFLCASTEAPLLHQTDQGLLDVPPVGEETEEVAKDVVIKGLLDVPPVDEDTEEVAKDVVIKAALDKLKRLKEER